MLAGPEAWGKKHAHLFWLALCGLRRALRWLLEELSPIGGLQQSPCKPLHPSSEIDYYLGCGDYSGAADALQCETTTIATLISFYLGVTSVVVSATIDYLYCVSVCDDLS